MFPDEREKDRNKWVASEYEKAHILYRERIAMIHRIQDFMDYMQSLPRFKFLTKRYNRDIALNRKLYCARIKGDPSWPDVDIHTYNMPIERVIADICGPIHRNFNVDWSMEPKMSGDVWLRTEIKPEYSTLSPFNVNVIVGDGIPKCDLVEDVVSMPYTKRLVRMKCS